MPYAIANVYKITFPANLAWFTKTITLQGVTYTLEMQYNVREQLWYMSVLDAAENPIILGIPITIDRYLNQQYSSYLLPNGAFVAQDTSGAGEEPTFFSFSLNHQLLFLDIQATG